MTEEQKKTLAFAIYALANYDIPLGEFLERSIVCINDTLKQGQSEQLFCEFCKEIPVNEKGMLCSSCAIDIQNC